MPVWMDPDSYLPNKKSHRSFELSTADGGVTWKTALQNLTSHIVRVRFGPDGRRVDLVDIGSSHAFELVETDPRRGTQRLIWRSEKAVIHDFWLAADGIYVAGVFPTGLVSGVVPDKVRVFRSVDYVNWKETPVDYRAVANRTMFAGGGSALWLATDTGMLLTFTP